MTYSSETSTDIHQTTWRCVQKDINLQQAHGPRNHNRNLSDTWCQKWSLLLSTHSLHHHKVFTPTRWGSVLKIGRTWSSFARHQAACSSLAPIYLQWALSILVWYFLCPVTTQFLYIYFHCMNGFNFISLNFLKFIWESFPCTSHSYCTWTLVPMCNSHITFQHRK